MPRSEEHNSVNHRNFIILSLVFASMVFPYAPTAGFAADEGEFVAASVASPSDRIIVSEISDSLDGPPPIDTYFDLDEYVQGHHHHHHHHAGNPSDQYYWQVLPDSLIYKSYLAGAKESRMSAKIINLRDQGALWDATLGGRIGLFRYGSGHRVRPEGFQLDVEVSAQVRLDLEEEVDVQSVDFRGGIPLTYGVGPFQTKLAYYHLSSHLGDEFLLKNPGFPRLNFSRDVVVLGQSIYLTDKLRIYGEAGYIFYNIIAENWEFQFGVDYSPACATGPRGAPFFAVNTHLRQEVNFGGNLTLQAGWAWRGDENARLLRVGAHYYNGESSQYSFFDSFEEIIGFGVWYDF